MADNQFVKVSARVLEDLIDLAQARAPKPVKKAPDPKPQPHKPGSMTTAEASQIVTGAIRRMQQEHNLSYPQAIERLKQEKPLIFAGYLAVKNRTKSGQNARKEH